MLPDLSPTYGLSSLCGFLLPNGNSHSCSSSCILNRSIYMMIMLEAPLDLSYLFDLFLSGFQLLACPIASPFQILPDLLGGLVHQPSTNSCRNPAFSRSHTWSQARVAVSGKFNSGWNDQISPHKRKRCTPTDKERRKCPFAFTFLFCSSLLKHNHGKPKTYNCFVLVWLCLLVLLLDLLYCNAIHGHCRIRLCIYPSHLWPGDFGWPTQCFALLGMLDVLLHAAMFEERFIFLASFL